MNNGNGPSIVFSTAAYRYLGDAVAQSPGFERGEVNVHSFPDGERYQRIVTQVEGRDVALIAGTVSDADTLELYDLACGLVEYGARALQMMIPYYGYSTMERAIVPGEVVTAKTRARLLSSIPRASWGDRVALLDVHTPGLPHYFEGNIRPLHIYGKPIIIDAARRLGGDDFVLACTDAGRAKWVQSLANDMGVEASFVFKRRISERQTKVVAASGHVEGRRVIIYDDMIRTGGSLIKAAEAYQTAGASSIAAITTHGVFPGDSLDRLRASGLFVQIVCTDSHPRAVQLRSDFLVVETITELIVNYLRGVTCN